MMKTGVALVVALVFGVVAGAYFANQSLYAKIHDAENQKLALNDELRSLRTVESKARGQYKGLNAENEKLKNELAALLKRLESQTVETEPVLAEPAPTETDAALWEERQSGRRISEDAVQPWQERRRGRPGRRPRQMSEDQVAQWQARRAERTGERQTAIEESRQRYEAFIEAQYQKATDDTARERLEALSDFREYFSDLRWSIRNSETPEDRQNLILEMVSARQDSLWLIEEAQDQMFRDLAEASGISDESQQAEFVEAAREVIESPFFENEQIFTGGGPGVGLGGPQFFVESPLESNAEIQEETAN